MTSVPDTSPSTRPSILELQSWPRLFLYPALLLAAAASLVCHPGESPELPLGVIRAVEFRVPVVVPSHGPLTFIDAPGVTRAGVPGDISAMARVVRTLLEKDRPSAEMTASFAENKPFGAALRRILMDE